MTVEHLSSLDTNRSVTTLCDACCLHDLEHVP